MNNTD